MTTCDFFLEGVGALECRYIMSRYYNRGILADVGGSLLNSGLYDE